MLRRIKVEGYKSLAGLDVTLKPLSVLFGPNAAGKSNLLDALQILSRMATSRTLREAFEPPCRGKPLECFAFGSGGVKGLLSQETASFTIEADVELSPAVIETVDHQIREMKKTKTGTPGDTNKSRTRSSNLSFVREKYLRYRVSIEILPKSGILRVADEYLAALNAKGEPTGKRSPFLEKMQDRLHLRMEGQAHPTYHDLYLDHCILSMPLYPPHYPHLVAMRQELASWFFFYFEPRERMRAANPVKEVHHIGLMGEELASFLNTLKVLDPRQFEAVEKSLHLVVPSVTGIDVNVNNLGQTELRLLEGNTPIPASVLSEGTLRILGLLALGGVKEPLALLGFEEPENGVHPRRIRMIAELLKTRASDTQLIVTTHSPILPHFIADKFLYVCRKAENRTVIHPFSEWGLPLRRKEYIDEALDAEKTEIPISQRILRGDFDA